ncbi:SpoIID/LytB domain-containing protein [Modestobacter versicolor]|uniref:SpoIID/LytB domain-containing protein n=1 Tax=Modestobacter versicolor TaxID=429133 RepID=UPI0034E02802
MRRCARLLGLLLAVVLAAGALLAGSAAAPTAAQAAPGDVTITGHGYGHGRGLSQWGSYGYATRHGWNHLNILGHYYSNATLGDVGDPLISVRLSALDNASTQVYSGQAFSAGGWDIQPGTVAEISRGADGSWKLTTRYGCNGAVGGSVPLNDTTFRPYSDPGDDINRMLSVCGSDVRTYRGALVVLWDGSAVRTVNYLSTQEYLRGVVPRESPASWGDANGGSGMNALMAQTVAARSYALAENRSAHFKTCDTTSCQVYGGAGLNGTRIEDRRTDYAVAVTRGQVLRLNGAIARAEFSSSSGGYTAGGTFPAVYDQGDEASPYHDWSTTVTADRIGSAFGVGTLQSVTVLSRNGLGADGGRVTKVRVKGTAGSKDVTGDAFRTGLGLRSDWFTVSGVSGPTYPSDVTSVDLSPTAMSAVRTGHGTVIGFVRGLGDTLWTTTAVNGVFDPFTALPGAGLYGPAAVSWDSGRIDLFVVGLDRALWHTSTTVDATGRPGAWAPYESLGGTLTSAVSAASNDVGNLVVTGRNTLGGVSYRVLSGGTWGAWQNAGGTGVTAPAAEVVDGGSYRLRVVGLDDDVWGRVVPSSGSAPSSAWVSTGRESVFSPTVSGTTWYARNVRAAAWPNGRGGVLQVRDATGLTVDLVGGISSSVAMVEMGDGSFWTFARGTDNALWVNQAAPNGASSWTKVGGYIV